MKHAAKTDEQLWAAHVAGDESALTELVGRYREPLGRYLTAKGLQAADADDVAQATFAQLVAQPDKLIRPLVFSIANRLALGMLAAS